MKTRYIALLSLVVVLVATTLTGAAAALQPDSEDQRALRARIEERYDVVPLSEGVALTPKARGGDVRLIEIADTIAINGIVVTGRELRDRVGADADAILRVSYLDPAVRRSLFAAPAGRTAPNASAPQPENRSTDRRGWERRRAGGDRVRVFGDVRVGEDEAVSGQVVAVIGSVKIDGEVGDQVVAVLGSVDLGPKAVVNGDVVSVGGRVRRADGSQVHGGVTEVSLADADAKLHLGPWMGGVGLGTLFDGFGALPSLLASTFRLMMLVLFASLAMVAARGTVEASARRVADDPIKSTLIGVTAEILLVPVLGLTTVILAISLIGIPLLVLMPFVVLFLLLLALAGFSGTAFAMGQWARRRFGLSTSPGLLDVCVGVVVILSPLLVGRLIALGGWPASPVSFLLIASGIGLEFLAWSAGFGAVLTNTMGRWQARRRVPVREATEGTKGTEL
jgi:hypothetical protein